GRLLHCAGGLLYTARHPAIIPTTNLQMTRCYGVPPGRVSFQTSEANYEGQALQDCRALAPAFVSTGKGSDADKFGAEHGAGVVALFADDAFPERADRVS